jgi:hypothetical protein
MLLADRPTTSRWTPPRGERSYQVRPILEGKNRGRHFVRKTPSPESIAFGVRPRFSLRPYANRRSRGHRRFNTRIAFVLPRGRRRATGLATMRASDPEHGGRLRFALCSAGRQRRDFRDQRQAHVRHLDRGTRQPPGEAHECFLRERSSACRGRLHPAGSRLRPGAGVSADSKRRSVAAGFGTNPALLVAPGAGAVQMIGSVPQQQRQPGSITVPRLLFDASSGHGEVVTAPHKKRASSRDNRGGRYSRIAEVGRRSDWASRSVRTRRCL